MSASSALEGLLDELQAGLEGLLSCFESERLPEPVTMDSVWLRVQQAFERLSGVLAGCERDEHRERKDHCLRLYAVATGLLARRREELQSERAACSDARQRLRGLRTAGTSGDSCDVRA